MKKYSFFFLVLAIAIWFAHAAAQDKPRYGGTLNVGLNADIYGLNPFIRMRSIDLSVRQMAYETLVSVDSKLEIKPWLAESWKVSPDQKEFAFNLRRGVKFHNGQEMTAEDWKWTVEYAQNPAHGATATPFLENVQAVRAPDRYTLRFSLKTSQASFLAALTNLRVLFVVPKGVVPTGETKFPTMPPGTGPFVFKEWRSGSHATFERFKDYWQKGLPYLDRVVFKPIPDDSARLAGLRAGELQIINRVPSQWVVKIQRGEIRGVKIEASMYSGLRELYLDVVRPPFDNVKARQALAYAIDSQQIVEGAYWGLAAPSQERFHKGSPWHFGFPERKRDLAKAKALLQEAGYKGEKITFISRQGQEEVQFIARQLQEAGFNVAVEVLEAGAYRRRGRTGDFHLKPGGGDSMLDPDQIAVEFMCDEEAIKNRHRENNATGYCNKQVDKLFDEAKVTTDLKKRRELYRKAFVILHEELPEIFLAFEHRHFGVHSDVRDFASDANESFNIIEGGIYKAWLAR
ncbi:MAG: ABC transporter substrate-binding protein [Candidatus Binatia bacterium]